MKGILKKFIATATAFCCILSAVPQLIFSSAEKIEIYEAENAVLTENEVKTGSNASGGKYVGQFAEDTSRIDFTVNVEQAGYYDIIISSQGVGGTKKNNLLANGTGYGEFDTTSSKAFEETTVSLVALNSGSNTVSITPSWGWINVDYIKVVKSTLPTEDDYAVSRTLINPNATDRAKRLMNFLADNYGKNVITGQQADNAYNSSEVNAIKNRTGGKMPAMIGLDLMAYSLSSKLQHNSNGNSIEKAIEVDEAGGIVTMCWHWRMYDEYLKSGRDENNNPRWWGAFYTNNIDKSKFNLTEIMNDTSSTGYQQILADIDYAAEQLKKLQDKDIPVLFRPLHEASGAWFWWGAYGVDTYKKLWNLMYDRMTNYHGLNNLIWVWNGQNPEWYPGDDRCDIMGEDIYLDNKDYSPSSSKFMDVSNYSTNKKITTLSETGPLFDIDKAKASNTLWSWFCVWGGSSATGTNSSSADMWNKVYNHENAITLDELPDLKTYPIKNDSQGTVYYQTSKGSDIRFILEVDEELAAKASSCDCKMTIKSSDGNESTVTDSINTAYRKIKADGKILEAAEGKCYIVCKVIKNVPANSSFNVEFSLDDQKFTRSATIEF